MHSDNTIRDALRSSIMLALGIVPANNRFELTAAFASLTEEERRTYARKFRKLKRSLAKDARASFDTIGALNSIIDTFVRTIVDEKRDYSHYHLHYKQRYPRTYAIVERTISEMRREKHD